MTRCMNDHSAIGTLALLIGLVSTAQVLSAQVQASPSTGDSGRFAYAFDCAGRYVRINLNTGDSTQPSVVPGVAAGGGGFDGCLVHNLAIDPGSQVVYAVMPSQRFVDSLGQRQEKVVALQPPHLQTLSTVVIPVSTNRIAKLRLDGATHTLTVGYHTPNGGPTGAPTNLQYVVSTARPEHLEFEPRSGGTTVAGHESSAPLLSERAFVGGSGRIVDGNRVISANRVASSITGYELLNDPLRQSFQNLQRTGATGNKYLDIAFADSAAGRMLFIVAWDTLVNQSQVGGGVVVYDAANSEVLSSFSTPYREAAFELTPGTPTVHLTPNGQRVVVEDYQWQSDFGATVSERRAKTGTVAVYDATSGNLLTTMRLDPPPGESGQVIGFSADSTLMYYASAQNIYVVDLSQGQSRTIKLPQGFFPTEVVTADR